MCIYISLICNIKTRLLFSEIIKLVILYFLSQHGIRARLLVTQMQIELVHTQIDVPLQGIVFSLVVT